VPRHPITEKDILPASMNAGVVASPLVEDSPTYARNGSIRIYFLAYLQAGISQNIVPAFACRVVDVTAYADGLPVAADSIFIQAINDISSTNYNLCAAIAPAAPPANAIARCDAVTRYEDLLPWNGDYIRIDMSSWLNSSAYVRITVEAI